MTLYAVAFIAWACPGGWLGQLVPVAARSVLCQARPAIELYDPARLPEARRRAAQLGQPAEIYRCTPGTCSAPLIDWRTTPHFREED